MIQTRAMDQLKTELLSYMRQHAYIHLDKPITLSSGKQSQDYFDGKQVTLFPETAILFARALLQLIKWEGVTAIGGPTLGADPIATAVSVMAYLDRKLKVPVFIVRKEAKKHGLQKMIEGCALKRGDRVVLVEDVITSGQSVLKAVEVVESIGCEVIQIACLVDREEGGRLALSRYHFTPLFTRSEIEK